MAYGTVKVDNITFDNGGSDQNVTVSGLYRATTSGVTVSGTIVAATVSGVTIIGSTTVSGATVTGTTANFTSGNFSNLISAAATMSGALVMANQQQVRFREAVGNGVNHIALQAPAIVSADQTITLPDQTGTVVTTGDNGSVSSTMLATNLTISAGAGSATTPSIAFTGDLNTGIYSPGADQLAVSTGGTGRLFVDASGNVGIGTSSPGYRLDVQGGNARIYGDGSGSSLEIGNGAVGNQFAFIDLVGDTTYSDYGLRLIRNNTGANAISSLSHRGTGALNIAAEDAGSVCLVTNNLVRVYVAPSTGNVGIGTVSPSTALHVQGSATVTSQANVAAKIGANTDSDVLIGSVNGNTPFIASQGAYPLVLFTNATERARIDSSGRLLVGTSSSRASRFVSSNFDSLLQIESDSEAAQSITRWSTSSNSSRLHLQKGRGTIASPAVVENGDMLGEISFSGYDSANMTNGARISAEVDGTPGANDMPSRLMFSTTADGSASPTERMRITSAGAVIVGGTSTDPIGASVSQVFACGPGANNGAINYYNSSEVCLKVGRGDNGALVSFFRNQPAATQVGNISVTTTATAYNTSSDYRLKENITAVTDSINRLQQLKPSRFNFIADSGTVVDGFLAHEAQEVVPECVTGEKDAVDDDGNPVYQGIDQSKLVPLLTAALQEAIGRIETLEAAVAALQGT